MNFIGVGVPEMILIGVLALIFVGPQKLPEVMGQIGRTVREIRRQASDVTRQFTDELDDVRSDYREIKGEVTTMRDQVREESKNLDRDLKSTVADAKKSLDAPKTPLIDKPSRRSPRAKASAAGETADEASAPEADGAVTDVAQALGAGKVVRMQRRSSKRALPTRPADDPKTNTNT